MYIPEITTWMLPNGLLIVWGPRNEVNTVYLDARVAFGSLHAENPAIPHAIEHLVEFSPTKAFPSEEELRSFATQYSIDSGAKTTYLSTEYSGSTTAENYKELISFFKERIFYSNLSQKTFRKEVARIKEESAERISDPTQNFLDDFLLNQTDGKKKNLERPIGSPKDIANLTIEDASDAYQEHYTASNTILLVSGPAELEKELRAEIEATFGCIPVTTRDSNNKEVGAPRARTERAFFERGKDGGQYYFAFALPFSSSPPTEELALKLVLEALYLQDSLLQNARDNFGLYHLEADYVWLPDSMILYLYGITENQKTATRIREYIKNALTAELLNQERFERAKQKQRYTFLTDLEFDTRTLDLIGTNYLRTRTILSLEETLSRIENQKFSDIENLIERMTDR